MPENEEQMEMSFRQKLEHFWEYEKWKVIIPIIIIIVIAAMVDSYRAENRELTLDISMINAVMESPSDVTFQDKYSEECNIDVENVPIRVETGMVHPKVVDEYAVMDSVVVASIQRYDALLLSGKTDVTITNTWVVEQYQKNDGYENLQELLPNDLYEKLQDKMFYCKDSQGKEIPAGIIVEDVSFLSEFYDEIPILTISKYSKRKEKAIEFVEWLSKQ